MKGVTHFHIHRLIIQKFHLAETKFVSSPFSSVRCWLQIQYPYDCNLSVMNTQVDVAHSTETLEDCIISKCFRLHYVHVPSLFGMTHSTYISSGYTLYLFFCMFKYNGSLLLSTCLFLHVHNVVHSMTLFS